MKKKGTMLIACEMFLTEQEPDKRTSIYLERRKAMNRNRPKISLGTKLFLLLTILVIGVTVFFLILISGADISTWKAMPILLEEGNEPPPEADDLMELTGEPTAVPQATQVPTTASELVHVTLRVAGDISLSESIRDSAMLESGEYEFKYVFSNVANLFEDADITLATLETITDDDSPYGNYNAPTALLDDLKNIGLHGFALATEHILDYGYRGLQALRAELSRRGLYYYGINESDTTEDDLPILSINGIQIAILNYTYGFSEAGLAVSETDRAVVKQLEMDQILNDIAMVRAAGAEIVIVMPHWGVKNQIEVTKTMRDRARKMAAAGADLILGSHSNVVSSMEMLSEERADGQMHDTLVCYSLGSFLVDARSGEENAAGMVLSAKLQYDPETRRVSFLEQEAVPIYIYQDFVGEHSMWRVINAMDEERISKLTEDLQEAVHRGALRVEEAIARKP